MIAWILPIFYLVEKSYRQFPKQRECKMALNFRNILELYGIPAGAESQTSFTIAENVDLFFNIFDKSKDDLVSRTEFERILASRNMPTSMVDNFFNAYAGRDNYLSKNELTAALNV